MPAEDRRDLLFEECVVARWRGYVSSSFVAALPDGSPVVESPSFKWRGSGPPPAEGAAAEAYGVLLAELEALGWERAESGALWYETRFRRSVEASAVEREAPAPPEPELPPPRAAAVVAPERPPGPEPEPEDGDGAARPYVVQEREQRRILSWSPDPFDAEPEPALEAAPPDAAVEPPAPQPAAAAPPARAPRERPRGRGRPRSAKTRRQVHFHIDAGDEQLLLAAARMFGSQQKGLIAALQALQERELLEEERDRLLAECERQRSRLAELEGLFGRPT